MRPIKEGDKVDVFYNNGFQLTDVTVKHIPVDVGDLWYFEDKNGRIYAQNPTSTNFDIIIKEKKKEE